MKARLVRFGAVEIDGHTYEHDVVINRGLVRKRDKSASKAFRGRLGHTPLTVAEDLPWGGDRLIIGTGADGALPILPEVEREATRRGVRLVAVVTDEACRLIAATKRHRVHAVLHVTC
ncbi:MTH938/NDUFAF3 family protein [Raineyella sp. LH-20]|uniref:MTH938/NDUFAF3 family protein n=1 Tax=Raineyella sp. LH-20 TaxID=3081204 RepID=UPI002954E15F|nr:MTH938/NDUFAF3 family protein [Raineyella sp. LH-20]WOP18278.1 MTH938/NDUFAF3 family protein [Raineyella sp. LH-20]